MSFKKVSNKNDFNSLINTFVNNRKQLRENINNEVQGLVIQQEKQVKQQKPTLDQIAKVTEAVKSVSEKVADVENAVKTSKSNAIVIQSGQQEKQTILEEGTESILDNLKVFWDSSHLTQSEMKPFTDDKGDMSEMIASIGVNGEINIPELNKGIVNIKNSENGNERDFKLTQGLAWLLQYPFKDLKGMPEKQKKNITKKDYQNYYKILEVSEISPRAVQNQKLKMVRTKLGIDKKDTTLTPVKKKKKSEGAEETKQEGSGLFNIDSAVNKLQVLIGSKASGNNSPHMKNEIMDTLDYLLHHKAINKSQHTILHHAHVN
jgi:hypothetical protein